MALQDLSKQDLIFLLESVEDSRRCQGLTEFSGLVERIKGYLDFDYAFCTSLNKLDVEPLRVVELSYPEEYLSRYFARQYYRNDHVANELLSTFRIQHWQEIDQKYASLKNREPATVDAYDFGLRDGLTYGTIDADQVVGTSFSFSGKLVDCGIRSTSIMSYMVPHLAEVLRRVSYPPAIATSRILSGREKEVLNWIKEGKSSWEIGTILDVQERTINFHIANIKKKLNATNRTQAVAMAIARGEICL